MPNRMKGARGGVITEDEDSARGVGGCITGVIEKGSSSLSPSLAEDRSSYPLGRLCNWSKKSAGDDGGGAECIAGGKLVRSATIDRGLPFVPNRRESIGVDVEAPPEEEKPDPDCS